MAAAEEQATREIGGTRRVMKADSKEKEDRQEDFFPPHFYYFFFKQANEVENEEQYQTLTHDYIS